MRRRPIATFLLIVPLLLAPAVAMAAPAGRVLLAAGEVIAIRDGRALRLAVGSAVEPRDLLRTGLDGHSITGPNPDGSRIADVTVDCLSDAKMESGDIDLIKLQAAGSPGADLAEANALRRIFGQDMPPLLSLKPALGHTLGASGLVELAALLACLDAERIPATAGFAEADPEIALFPMVDRSTAHVDRALLNLIGFGGGLASLLAERRP